MNIAQIEENIIELSQNITEEFIFNFLLSYWVPKATVTLMKKGKTNLSKNEHQKIVKRKIFFHELSHWEDSHVCIENLQKDEKTHKHKPRFIIVTDYKILLAIDTKTQLNLECEIDKIWKFYDFFLPLAWMEKSEVKKESLADVKAAYKLARLYDSIREENIIETPDEIHALNKFLSRLLFCYFAEDTGVFPKDIFTLSLEQLTENNWKDVSDFLQRLFDVLDTKEENRKILPEYLNKFPYVNGKLFTEKFVVPKFNTKSRKNLIEAWKLLNWADINPDIFGSMVQAVVHPSQRENMGMHYTSVPNIMKVIQPLFLDELNEEFESNIDNPKKLQNLLTRLSNIRVFDPACGSWNFLIIAYKELRVLEMKILKSLYDDNILTLPVSHIQLSQFYWIEIDDFACEVAELSLYIANHQMNLQFRDIFKVWEAILPLKSSWNITQWNATRIEWGEVCSKNESSEIYIVWNPPYLGSKLQDANQKNDMQIVFEQLAWYKMLDYITTWFFKAANYIKWTNYWAAFVTTNSICQWEQVSLLWPSILNMWLEINFAHNSFRWSNNAKRNAWVIVSIIWIRKVSNSKKTLFFDNKKSYVDYINAYLVSWKNVIVYKRTRPLSVFPEMNFGNMPNDGWGLIINNEEKIALINKYPEITHIIKKLVWSSEFIQGWNRNCLWIEDSDLPIALKSQFIKERIAITKKHRESSRDKSTNELAKRSHQFRDRNTFHSTAIIVPSVSSIRRKYIPSGFISIDSVISNSAQAIYDPEIWIFGMISSHIHMVWVRSVAWRLKTDYRYSKNLCYNTFPFPDISEKKKRLIEEHVYNVLDEREKHSEKTLAELYDPDKMPQWLKQAHEFLDEVIEKCYRATPFKNDEERLSYLFKMYEQMIEDEKNNS